MDRKNMEFKKDRLFSSCWASKEYQTHTVARLQEYDVNHQAT